MSWLIDPADRRFKIPVNADIIDYIERANPFAHSDLGQKLIDLNCRMSEGSVYCRNLKICADMLLHSDAKPSRNGGERLDIPAFPPGGQTADCERRLANYCAVAQRHAGGLVSKI